MATLPYNDLLMDPHVTIFSSLTFFSKENKKRFVTDMVRRNSLILTSFPFESRNKYFDVTQNSVLPVNGILLSTSFFSDSLLIYFQICYRITFVIKQLIQSIKSLLIEDNKVCKEIRNS